MGVQGLLKILNPIAEIYILVTQVDIVWNAPYYLRNRNRVYIVSYNEFNIMPN